jgi:hypothetical protein
MNARRCSSFFQLLQTLSAYAVKTTKILLEGEADLPLHTTVVIYQLNDDDLEQTKAVVGLVADRVDAAQPYSFTYCDTYRLLVTDASGAQETALAMFGVSLRLFDFWGKTSIHHSPILNLPSSAWQIQLQNCLHTKSMAVELQRSTLVDGNPTWNTIAKMPDLARNQTATFEFPHFSTSSPVLYVFATKDQVEMGRTIDVIAYSPYTAEIVIPPQRTLGYIVAHCEGDAHVGFAGNFFNP